MLKQLPYGLSDFKRVKTENYYYIDKTSFIQELENAPDFLFFLRPRRFGKSLTIAMLCAYYDIWFAPEFDEILKDTYILDNPTPLKNSFYTLKFDFSGVDTPANENDHYGLRYATFVVPLVKAVQEQQEIIETQQVNIENLKQKNVELEAKVSSLKSLENRISELESLLNVAVQK